MTRESKEFEAAANYEIDVIFAHEVGEDLLAELPLWLELRWQLLPCGCLVGPEGHEIHRQICQADECPPSPHQPRKP